MGTMVKYAFITIGTTLLSKAGDHPWKKCQKDSFLQELGISDCAGSEMCVQQLDSEHQDLFSMHGF